MALRSHIVQGTRVVVLALLIVSVCGWTPTGVAQPLVQVHAATRIELHSNHGPTGARVGGVLLDDLDAPLANASVELRVSSLDEDGGRDVRRVLRTGPDGGFRVELPLPLGKYLARASFAGEGHHGGCSVEHSVDLTRADVRLTFLAPRQRRVDLGEAQATLRVRASSGRGGGGLTVRITDELGREIANGTTDDAGIFEAVVAADALGPPSMGRLVATSESDTLRTRARAETPLLRMLPTQIELTASEIGTAFVLRGELRTHREALARRAVGIFADSEHVATVLTDGGGHFEYDGLTSTTAGDEDLVLSLRARFDSDAPWYGSSRSEVVELVQRGVAPPSGLWLLLPVLLCALVLWWLARRDGQDPERRPQSSVSRPRGGIEAAAPTRRGRPTQRHVGGRVVSADHGRALAGAHVELISDGGSSVFRSRTGDDGHFEAGPLDDGGWTLRIVADGYAPTAQHVTVPHRGEWGALTARLQSLRTAALRAFAPAAEAAAGAHSPLQTTPREAMAQARARGRAGAAFHALVRTVERAAFGRAAPMQDDVDAIEREAEQVAQRRARGEPPGP